jgi:HPt (histidine-containing phosphotransfer) domain-containing protein
MSNNLKIIDFNHLDSIINGDEGFKKELIRIFLEQIPVFIDNMKKYFESNKLEELAREAHTAKSSALIFGMENTGQLLKEIQFLSESKEPSQIPSLIKQVETELNHAKTELLDALKDR